MTDSPSESDPRVPIVAEELALAILRNVGLTRFHLRPKEVEAQEQTAVHLLATIDGMSPNETIRQLRRTLDRLTSDDDMDWDLARAMQIVAEVRDLTAIQAELKRAFKNDELDGGWKTALEHPMYMKAQRSIDALQGELKGLI